MATRGELVKVVSMRLSADDDRLLQAVAKRAPAIPALALLRIAARIGLEAIQKDPTLALENGTKRRK